VDVGLELPGAFDVAVVRRAARGRERGDLDPLRRDSRACARDRQADPDGRAQEETPRHRPHIRR
jgi:hypothetical protein